jgi:hypothetical protein
VLPSRVELYSIYQIESIFAQAMGQAEAKLSQWKAAVDRGRVVRGFGASAGRLLETLDGFDRATQAFALIPLRLKKHDELKAFLSRSIGDLVRRQLALLQQQGMKRFRAALVPLVGKDNREDEELNAQKALEDWFDDQAADVVVPGVMGSYEQAKTDFARQLTDFAAAWPNSPAYNIQAMKRLEATSKRKKRGKMSLGYTFQLVSLLRLPGDGNLQGFATYQAGPVQFMLGCQNDRNLQENRIEGQVPPFIRVQPKIAFDVDL